MVEKLRIVYVPFLTVSAICIIAYTFLDWLLFIKLQIFTVDDEILRFWGPAIVAWIAVLFWLRPRINALKLKNPVHHIDYQAVAVAAIAAPTIFVQLFLTTATGVLTSLDRVSKIDQAPKTKYYSIAHLWANKADASMHVSVRPAGGRTPELVVSTFFVVPLQDSVSDSHDSEPKAWLGSSYFQNISNRLFDLRTEQEEKIKSFIKDVNESFQQEDLANFSYFERLTNNKNRAGFESAVHENSAYAKVRLPIILLGAKTPFEARNGHKLWWTLGAFAAGPVVWFLMLMVPKLDKTYLSRAAQARRVKVRLQLESAIYREIPITISIAAINILVFLAMVCSGLGVTSFDTHALLAWGANYFPFVEQGQWFRLITSMFVHAGLMHLAVNLYGLLLAGVLLEPLLGKARFVFLYLAAGITGSFFSILFHPSTMSVGASGAIFGLYGALITTMILQNRGQKNRAAPPILNFLIYVGANLLIGSLSRGVDNAAHIGGLFCGMSLSAVFAITARDHTACANR